MWVDMGPRGCGGQRLGPGDPDGRGVGRWLLLVLTPARAQEEEGKGPMGQLEGERCLPQTRHFHGVGGRGWLFREVGAPLRPTFLGWVQGGRWPPGRVFLGACLDFGGRGGVLESGLRCLFPGSSMAK